MNKSFIIPPKPKALTKLNDKKLKVLVKQELKTIKEHFKECAYPLDAELIINNIICDYFGFDLPWVVYSIFVNNMKGIEVVIDGKFDRTIRNTKDKLFYSPRTNKIYEDISIRDVNLDIQLGEL